MPGPEPMTVLETFERALAARGFHADPSQHQAALRLQRLYEEWIEYKSRRCWYDHRFRAGSTCGEGWGGARAS
jgi:predicted ATPase